jgi:ribosomal protein S18 acetylase RimI-like enzyme
VAEVLVREASKNDLPAVVSLWQELALFHAKREKSFHLSPDARTKFTKHRKEVFGRENTHLAVAVRRGKVIAYCSSQIDTLPPIFDRARVGQIVDMCVTARCRRRGVGRLLFDDARQWFRSNGIDRIEVVFAKANEVSTAFWLGLGFREFTEKRYLEI